MTASSYKYLYQVDSPRDLRRLSADELRAYCGELRHFIIEQLSANPGHLGSSLGVVELAAALHYVFDTPNDKLIWDVGHQAYAHKIITGRRDRFLTNRKLNGLSGFPSMSESEYDAFGTGHASTSISAALGMAAASALRGEKREVIAVIRRRRADRRTGFRGTQQRRSREHRPARDPERQPHGDRSERRGAEGVSA